MAEAVFKGEDNDGIVAIKWYRISCQEMFPIQVQFTSLGKTVLVQEAPLGSRLQYSQIGSSR
jgi:hypothetical protein